MTLKKSTAILLCLCLVFSLAAIPVTSCSAAEPMYQISETQLAKLEQNNQQLTQNNKKQLEELTELQNELRQSKAALEIARQSLNKMRQYTEKLEKQVNSLNISKVAPVLAYGNKAGFMAGLRLKTSPHYDVSLVGNTKSFVMSVAYSF
mgnify:CR=1 FL=1